MEKNQATQTIVSDAPRRKAKRRGQRGSILRRGSSWSVVYRTPDGKQKWQGGYRTKEEAQKQVDIILGSIRENRYVEPKEIIFREFCDDWMKTAKSVLKPKTWASYQSALKNWILPKFGVWPICDINRASVKTFKDNLLMKQRTEQKVCEERPDFTSPAF